MAIEKLLKQHFNFEQFRPGQKEVVTSILAGNHTLAMLPTGTGKSLCYQLPGYAMEGHVLIISPLLSLMQDQVEQMKMRGEKSVIALNSFLSNDEKKSILQQLNRFKFIFISPEMLRVDFVLNSLKKLNISLYVIDEAHCISQWGYDFRPDYMKLGKVRESLGNPLTLALTATATKEVRNDIITSLNLPEWKEYISSVDRPNISIQIEKLERFQDKIERLIEIVQTLKGPGIIYFSSKRMVEDVVQLLKQRGIHRVMPYHGGMDQENRILIQQQFINGQLDVICATSAFGMGVNKENIRFVVHFHVPLQLESYLQEIGRAGRDGGQSIAILLYSPGDELLSFQLAEGEFPSEPQIDWLYLWLKQNKESLLNLSAFKEEIRMIGGFTDVQLRLMEDFLTNLDMKNLDLRQSLLDFKVQIQKRIEIKRKKVSEIIKWIQSSHCRREKILNYFDEEKKIEVWNCCDQCGIDFEIYLDDDQNQAAEISTFDWKAYLGEILLG